MSRSIPPGTTLDALRREAKRWLKALRAGDADARARLRAALPGEAPAEPPTLRQAQHALAREHGCAGWRELAARVEGAGTLPRYERVAAALEAAYNAGDAEALRVVWDHFGHMRALDGMRRYVRLDLGRREAPDDPAADAITRDEARWLVARGQGFASWDALAAHAATVPADRPTALTRPVALRHADADDEGRDPVLSRDWEEALAILRERRLPALHAHGQMTDAVLARAARLGHLTALDLSGSRALTDEGVRHLARLPGLRHLDLSGCAVTDAGLAALGALPALETLSLARAPITDAGVAHVAASPRLRHLNLRGTRTGDGALRALDGAAALRRLQTGEQVTDAGLPALRGIPAFATWLGGEERLELTGAGERPNALTLRGVFTDAGMRALAALEGLYALDLDGDRLAVTAAGLAPLAALPHLQWLAVDARDDATLAAVAALPRLRFLVCQDTPAGDDGFAALARARTLEYLWGRRCHNLGGRGFRALSTLPALRSLAVSCLHVDDDALAALPDFPALRELMPIDVPDAGYRHVARCAALESLILMYCRETGDEATSHVARLPALRRYFASYTRATDRSLELLATVETLEEVTLDSVAALTDAGVAALSRLPNLRSVAASGMIGVTPQVRRAFGPAVRLRLE